MRNESESDLQRMRQITGRILLIPMAGIVAGLILLGLEWKITGSVVTLVFGVFFFVFALMSVDGNPVVLRYVKNHPIKENKEKDE